MNFNTNAVFDQQEGLVVLVGKKMETQTKLPKVVAEELEIFHKNADAQFLHLPIKGKHFVFIREQATDEKLRIMGNKLRGALPKEVKSILIDGGKTSSLLLAEGFALSSYQYLKYRKEAKKEKFAIESIDFSAKISDSVIEELSATLKAVFWARDLVNEPVSGLNATQLAEAIEEKGKEAAFPTIQVDSKFNPFADDQPTKTFNNSSFSNPKEATASWESLSWFSLSNCSARWY